MNWPIILCLAGAVIAASMFFIISREIIGELSSTRRFHDDDDTRFEDEISPRDEAIILSADQERPAELKLRHSLVAAMMEKYQAVGEQRNVIDFINDELSKQKATWRVRFLPNGNGEIYDCDPELRLDNEVAVFIGSRALSG